ncbi:MAG: carbohydrate kinase, partial [Ruminococcaceae bacterium]|nr:carbohydrate kinase [Oscillospiraceae bacterium]
MIEKKYDVIALGECLVDFLTESKPQDSSLNLKGNPGGAPANVLAGLSKLEKKTAFIGKVGRDIFGRFLVNAISSVGVDVSGMIMSEDYLTTLAMVALDDSADREFSFYRDNTADVMLQTSEIDYEKIRQSRIFHFGSVSMTTDPARTATFEALKYAMNNNILIS